MAHKLIPAQVELSCDKCGATHREERNGGNIGKVFNECIPPGWSTLVLDQRSWPLQRPGDPWYGKMPPINKEKLLCVECTETVAKSFDNFVTLVKS